MTAKLTYGPVTAQPQYPGDPDPKTYYRRIYAEGCATWEAARTLEKLGFHVGHPATHPNGSGGVAARVYVPLPKGLKLPKTIEV